MIQCATSTSCLNQFHVYLTAIIESGEHLFLCDAAELNARDGNSRLQEEIEKVGDHFAFTVGVRSQNQFRGVRQIFA